MNWVYRLFKLNPGERESIISVTSGLNIVLNVLIASAKVLVGLMVSSIAIVGEGVNNAADAVTSVLAFVGARLARKHPDEKHPFGYGRIEYLASLVVAALILVTGLEMLTGSVKAIFEPAELRISIVSLVILAVTAVVKFLLGIYTIKMGKKAESGALVGVGTECRNDAYASVITIATAVVFLVFGLSLDAYAGIIIAALIIKAGGALLFETVNDLLGRSGEKELADELYKEIRSTEGVLAAADMMLHNYGPNAWSGSVNVEIDRKKTVGEVYRILHELQLRIMHEKNVTMVFGVYAVDNDHEEAKALRAYINNFVKSEEYVESYHAVYIDSSTSTIYCDFIVDYKLRDWNALREKFTEYMKVRYPEYGLELVVETEFV